MQTLSIKKSNVKALAVGIALALVGAAGLSPVLAQQTPPQQTPQTGQAEQDKLIGMQVYTSDNQQLGQVIQLVSYNGEVALRAEIGSFLGFGTTTVVIPNGMFVAKPDRIEVTMTAAEVREAIDKQK